MNLNLTSHDIYSILMCELRFFAGPPIYHLPVNVISATVGLVYINVRNHTIPYHHQLAGPYINIDKANSRRYDVNR